MSKRVGIILFVLFAAVAVNAQVSVGFAVTPETYIPVGPQSDLYRPGIGGRGTGLISLPGLDLVSPSVEVAYVASPLALGTDAWFGESLLSIFRLGAGAHLGYPFTDRVAAFARAHGSLYFAGLTGELEGSATSAGFGLSAGVSYLLASGLLLGGSVGYDSYPGLYDAVSISLGATLRLSGPGSPVVPRADFGPSTLPASGFVRFAAIDLDRIFPVLYKYYDTRPIGSAVVVNDGARTIEDVEVRLRLEQFMDQPKLSARIDRLEPGEEQRVEIFALFTDSILSATEGLRVAAEVSAEYKAGEQPGSDSEVVTLVTYDRNALQWDDDQKIAAFVTARDDQVLRFARNVAAIVRDRRLSTMSEEVQLAMGLFGALDEHGCEYVVDPTSAYEDFSDDPFAVDSVQFPLQTLEFRAGDCDDLSATYAALLQAVGIETAFVTIPGHIFMAFRIGMGARDARRAFSRPEDIIVRPDGSVWIPVETTLVGEDFARAWAIGARQWRQYEGDGAAFFTTADAWLTYEPVAFGVSDINVTIPARDVIEGRFDVELQSFVNREIADREQTLLDRVQARPTDVRSRNRLGVLYARYGRTEQARAQFLEVLRLQAYPPALTNLGNLEFLNGNLVPAQRFYDQALDEDPENEEAVLGIARVAYRQEDYAAAQAAHARLSSLSPELAERFDHLGSGSATRETGRASDAAVGIGIVVWGED